MHAPQLFELLIYLFYGVVVLNFFVKFSYYFESLFPSSMEKFKLNLFGRKEPRLIMLSPVQCIQVLDKPHFMIVVTQLKRPYLTEFWELGHLGRGTCTYIIPPRLCTLCTCTFDLSSTTRTKYLWYEHITLFVNSSTVATYHTGHKVWFWCSDIQRMQQIN